MKERAGRKTLQVDQTEAAVSRVFQLDQARKDAERSAAEASAWIAKMDKGMSDADTDALLAWMRANPRNEAELLEMARMWDKMDALARLSEVFPHAAETGSPPVRGMGRRMAMAASFVVVVAGFVMAALILNPYEDKPPPSLASATAAYETAIGSLSAIELPDGSSITLNTNSRAVVSYGERRRIVRLEQGEMHIDVAQDPTRPLSVIAGGRIVQAVGTAFSVKIDPSQRVEVLVADGRVQVGVHEQGTADIGEVESLDDSDGQWFLVAQGERVVLNANSETVEALEPEEMEVRLSWRNGNLIFRGESLAAAVAEVGRYTPVEFVIEDEDLQQVRVAGLFKSGDVAGFLSSLEANFDIVHRRADDETIRLSAAKSRNTDAPK